MPYGGNRVDLVNALFHCLLTETKPDYFNVCMLVIIIYCTVFSSKRANTME